jgi:hypothetical protein
MAARWLGIVTGLAVLALALPGALAAPPDASSETQQEAQAEVQRHFGFGAQLGFYNPNGLAARAGWLPLSIEAAAGFTPTLLSYGGNQNPRLELIAPLELTPQILVGDIKLSSSIHGAFRTGYRYNWALGHGATFGGQLSKRYGHLQLEGLWGISIYPDAARRVRDDGTVPETASFNFPPALTWGLTVGLLYYP